MTSASDRLRLFALNNLAIEAAVQRIEREQDINLGHRPPVEGGLDETYYPQFDEKIRSEAADMSAHYRVFYCLENSIRSLITEVLLEKHGSEWWNAVVPENVKTHVAGTQKKEAESGIAIRSQEPIDYTTFGELGGVDKLAHPQAD